MAQPATKHSLAMKKVQHTQKARICIAVVRAVFVVSVLMARAGSMQAQQTTQSQQAADAKQIPAVDGDAGPCSVEFTVTDGQGHPVYAANINVHIAYGFMGTHKLDLQVGTNFDGKASFTGLPQKVKGGTMYFQASQGVRTGSAFYNPVNNCIASEGIFLSK